MSSGRIEISIEEYIVLKNKIKTLESSLIDVSKDASKYKEKSNNLESLMKDVESLTLIERVLHWKQYKEQIIETIGENDEK